MRSPTLNAARAIVASLLLSATLFGATGCGAPQQETTQDGATTQTQEASAGAAKPSTEDYNRLLLGKNLVSTFIGEKFYDKKVTNDEEALDAVKSVYDRIGADSSTNLEITAETNTETGYTYYTFNQVAGDVFVNGASVKVITNKDKEVVGVVSAILPNTQVANAEDWQISQQQAEQLVVEQCASNGYKGVEPIKDATEQTLIPIQNRNNNYQYAWVVYTNNYLGNSEMAYLAHYVDADGSYLYAIPISEPHNADAQAGDKANFDFDKYTQDTWTGNVNLHDGTTKEITVPVLVDKETNTQILGDAKRKILCADYAEWDQKETLAPSTSNDATFNNVDLLAYDTFIKVWDFYDGIGWSGPDGDNTPTLLLMNLVNKDGEPYDSAFYSGRTNGFQLFAFNRLNPDGENMDIIAHEFTHCVTSTAMTTNLYYNDMGAINEGMSDVLGNLVEMIEVNRPETAWLMGDSSGGPVLRNMKNPHEHQQPEFRWDVYYTPPVTTGTETNDNGGVHSNSSMLNIVSYKLDQAGMAPEDQVYFWLNVALAMTPTTDYDQMAKLLPWCMEQSGYPQYKDVLVKAIEEASFPQAEAPATPAKGTGKVTLSYPSLDIAEQGVIRLSLYPKNASSTGIDTWPTANSTEAICFVPAGEYYALFHVGSDAFANCDTYSYTSDGWKKVETSDVEEISDDKATITVEDGKTLELPATGLPETLEQINATDAAA